MCGTRLIVCSNVQCYLMTHMLAFFHKGEGGGGCRAPKAIYFRMHSESNDLVAADLIKILQRQQLEALQL